NAHYAAISRDANYIMPVVKSTVSCFSEWPEESVVYNALSVLKETTEGPDDLPYWFLKLASPCIAAPLAYLFKLSLSRSIVPTQWKSVNITPVPKISQ